MDERYWLSCSSSPRVGQSFKKKNNNFFKTESNSTLFEFKASSVLKGKLQVKALSAFLEKDSNSEPQEIKNLLSWST